MKLLSLAVLSTFILVGLYMGGYSLLYKQKVKDAQKETSILTPPQLFRFLNIAIIISFSVSAFSLLFLFFELIRNDF